MHVGAQSRGLRAPCERFAPGVTPGPRITRFRLAADLGRMGLDTHRVSNQVSKITSRHLVPLDRAFPAHALVHRKYRRLFSSSHRPRTPGPKGPSDALIRAIVELKSRNPRFGCPRIARIISRTFGVDIDKNVVARVLAKHYRPAPGGSGPSWLSFIGHATDSLWSVDLFRCESIVLQSYWVLVVMDQCTRRLVGFGVHRGSVDAPGLCRMFNAATHGQGAPRHLSTDHDPLFEAHRWQANLRLLEIDEIKTVPHVPLSHPFVERLIGTIRREFLDQVFFWNGRDLERKLADFQAYYNAARSHASLDGHTPFAVVKRPRFSWTRIKGESNVQGGGGNGSVERRGTGRRIGTDGGSPEGDWSPCRRGGGRGGLAGAGAAVERQPEARRGAAAAAWRIAGGAVP